MKNYAVILKFDKRSENQIQKLIHKLNKELGVDYLIPPHITLGVFQTDDLDKYVDKFNIYSRKLRTGEVIFASLGQFVPKVIYLAPLMNEVLLYNHSVISEMLEDLVGQDELISNYAHYQKDQWQPHCTLGAKLDTKKMLTGLASMLKDFKPIIGKIKSVSIVEGEPYLELPALSKTIRTKPGTHQSSTYAVKVISKIIVEGSPEFTDKNYSDDINYYEEQVLLFEANSSNDAYKKAERYMAKAMLIGPHKNIYGQTVRDEVLEYVDCYELFEKPSNQEPEVYSSMYFVPKEVSDEVFLSNRFNYYIDDEEQDKHDKWEDSKRKVILNAEFEKLFKIR